MAFAAQSRRSHDPLGGMFGFERRLWVTRGAVDRCRVALGMTQRAVAIRAVMILREFVFSQFRRLETGRGMAFRAIVVGSLVRGWRCVAVAAYVFQAGQTLGAMAFAAIQARMFSIQLDRMIEGVFGPGCIGSMAATAGHGNAVRADVTGLTILWTAHFIFLVTFLATLSSHHAALARRFVLGNVAAVATGAGKRRIAMRAVVRRMANGAIAHGVGLGRGGDLGGNVHVHQASMAVRALFFIVQGMRHAQRRAHTGFRARFPGMATQTTCVPHVRVFRQPVICQEMRENVRHTGSIHLDIAGNSWLGVAREASYALVRRGMPLVVGGTDLVAARAETGLHRDRHGNRTGRQEQADRTRGDGPRQFVGAHASNKVLEKLG